MAFKIIRNDITQVAADAIVNTANPDPAYGSGTDGAIYEAAGADELLAERLKIGEMEVGQAAYTPAFRLNARYIIHTVGPAWDGGSHGELESLRKCYENSLALADELKCQSIAFPLISTGVYGFPKDKALQTAISVFSEFLVSHEMEIILVVFDRKSFEVSGQIFAGIDEYIDENRVSDQLDEEYGSSAAYEAMACHSSPSFFGASMAAMAAMPMPEASSRRRHVFADRRRSEKASEERISEEAVSLGSVPTDRRLEDVVAHISDTWQESLFHLIDEKGYVDVDVYKRANVDRKLFSKIRTNRDYQPKKITAVAFALALELNLDETRDFLRKAGYALSPSSVFDLIIEYFIEHEVYDIMTINIALFDHDQPIIGA